MPTIKVIYLEIMRNDSMNCLLLLLITALGSGSSGVEFHAGHTKPCINISVADVEPVDTQHLLQLIHNRLLNCS